MEDPLSATYREKIELHNNTNAIISVCCRSSHIPDTREILIKLGKEGMYLGASMNEINMV